MSANGGVAERCTAAIRSLEEILVDAFERKGAFVLHTDAVEQHQLGQPMIFDEDGASSPIRCVVCIAMSGSRTASDGAGRRGARRRRTVRRSVAA